jgi:dsDNA-binding SOS-regulon protein
LSQGIIPPKNPQKYRCGYVDEMRKLEGQVAVITKCTYSSSSDLYPDDNYTYKIDIDDLHLTWSSQSFVKLEEFQQATLQLFQSDITSVQADDTISTIQCSKLSIFDCLSDDRSAKEEEEKEEKKERYKLNFKIK